MENFSTTHGDPKQEQQIAIINPFSGDIFVEGNNLKIQLKLVVYSPAFKYANKYMIIKDVTGAFKAIVFMYNDPPKGELIDFENNSPVLMPIVHDITHNDGWKEGDKVRLMCLNENNENEFTGLTTYFKERLDKFKNVLYPSSEYDDFIKDWNHKNPNNRVASNSISPNKIDKPRFTKDDGMLTLKKL